jgi:hypothetical protein
MQIFFNGKELDLNLNERVAITIQSNDLAEISKPNTSFTNAFKIPKTANNVAVMKYLGVVGSTSRIPYQLNNVNLFEDSFPLMINGYCAVQEVLDDSYSINIYGSEKTFFEKLKNVTLKDIYPSTPIMWNGEVLINYVNASEVFCFPVAQYNADTRESGFLSSQAFIKTLTTSTSPHFFVKYLFETIFAHLGYVVEYPMSDEADFKRLVIPSMKGVSHFNAQNNSYFDIKQCLHEVACDVFVKELMQRYGLVVKCDEFNKKVTFVKMDYLLSSSPIIDWTDKFQSLSSHKYSIGSYGQKNYYKYADDVGDETFASFSPAFAANILDGVFQIENELLPVENVVFESAFSKASYWGDVTLNSGYETQGRLFYSNYPFGHFLFDVAENSKSDDGQYSNEEVPFNLMYLKTLSDQVDFTFIDTLGGNYTARVPIRICTNDNISFQHYLDTHYTQLKILFNSMEVVKVKMKLSVLDIYGIDLFKRVYLQQLGSYFFINKITNWEKNKIAEVELVKIPPVN